MINFSKIIAYFKYNGSPSILGSTKYEAKLPQIADRSDSFVANLRLALAIPQEHRILDR